MKYVYLDNSATTMPCEAAIKAAVDSMTDDFANPSSLYEIGLEANALMEKARKNISSCLGCLSQEFYFTSGGTEANNIALQGAFYANWRKGRRVVTTSIEHPSVLNTLKEICLKNDIQLTIITPNKNGVITEEDIYNAIDSDVFLVSIMLVNNETGAINPVLAARKAIDDKNSPALLHCDCVQAFGKLPFTVSSIGADLVSISGHKVHSPKGIGGLYVKKGVRLNPLIYGGGQEKGIRPGTQPTPLISAFSAAVTELKNNKFVYNNAEDLFQYAVKKLTALPEVYVNSPKGALPYILNISVMGYRSEVMLRFLSGKGVFVSSGSACAKGKRSYVLTSMGLSPKRIDSAIRISFSRYNTLDDIDELCDAISEGQKNLLKSR